MGFAPRSSPFADREGTTMTAPHDGRFAQARGGTSPNTVQLDVLLASRGSPTAAAMTSAFTAPTAGFTPVQVRAGGEQPERTVHPPTIMLNKVPSPTEAHANLVAGPCQLGIAQGVLDAVADGTLTGDRETLVFAAVWLSPAANSGGHVRLAAREAVRSGAGEAVHSHDEIADLIAERDALTRPCCGR